MSLCGCLPNLKSHFVTSSFRFLQCESKHEILGESVLVAADGLIQSTCGHAIERRKIAFEHNVLATHKVIMVLDGMGQRAANGRYRHEYLSFASGEREPQRLMLLPSNVPAVIPELVVKVSRQPDSLRRPYCEIQGNGSRWTYTHQGLQIGRKALFLAFLTAHIPVHCGDNLNGKVQPCPRMSPTNSCTKS